MDYLAKSAAPLAVPDKWHHVIAQILPGGRLLMVVDDQKALEAQQTEPTAPARYPGLWTWSRGQFDNVRIYTGEIAQ